MHHVRHGAAVGDADVAGDEVAVFFQCEVAGIEKIKIYIF